MTTTVSAAQTHTPTRREPQMRRYLAPALVGLGAFLLVAAALVRFYAFPTLAVAPIDLDSETNLEAQDATIFNTDPKVLKEMQTDLSVVSLTRGNVEASEKLSDKEGEDLRVWSNVTVVTSADGVERSKSTEQTAHDADSAEAVASGENWIEVAFDSVPGEKPEIRQVPTEPTGLVFKFPFGTEQKTYAFWDGTLERATDATFEGQEEIDGLKVYKFVQEIPQTKVGSRDVPASVFGLEGEAVTADSMYSMTRTMWVEPRTGAIIDRVEDQLETYEYDGNTLTATDAEVRYTAEQVQENVDDIGAQSRALGLLAVPVPLGAAVLGLLAIAGGVLLQRRRA